ncbi:MAG: hypothetical protein GX299_03040 [Epulopiscium sp.]|jgi:hypothetical protein|nr:hypothetical protein [Candidatus Epulonipiscium sp.]
MEKRISHDKLCHYLTCIKNTLNDFDFSSLENVVFFDSHSFYCYLAGLPCKNNNTIEAMLEEIEDCIPFALTHDSFSLFLEAYEEEQSEKMEALRKGFIESCKVDFLLLMLHMEDASQWEHLVDTCENLRQKNYC